MPSLPKDTAAGRWLEGRVTDAATAVSGIQSGDRVFVQGGHATSVLLLEALVARADELSNVEVMHLHSLAEHPHLRPGLGGHIRHNALFAGPNSREAVQSGRADYTPVFLADVPGLITSGRLGVDVALVQVSPPDAHGFCSLGPSVDIGKAALETARLIIAEINPRVPRTHGYSCLHSRDIDFAVFSDHPLPVMEPAVIGPEAQEIGRLVATLIEDGSTLQTGIGAVPSAVLNSLHDKHDLGIHSELLPDGVVDLFEAGVITGRHKTVDNRLIVGSFALGTQKILDFIHDNPGVHLVGTDRTNDTARIRRQDKMIAINSAIEVDLSGQVAAESIGPMLYSGTGGQMDFMRGASLARGGKAVIAITATARGGTASRITPMLAMGAAVTTPRDQVQYVVTEYGIAELSGRTLKQRGEALLAIAHPDFRAEIRRWLRGTRSFALSSEESASVGT